MSIKKFDKPKHIIAVLIYLSSVIFFILGLTHPIMGAEVLLGLKETEIYLYDSFEYFFKKREYVLGTILLIFTLVLPIFKYLFIGLKFFGFKFYKSRSMHHVLEIINKWAMLDVFIVALLIMTFKFESSFISNYVMIGASYFAISILLLMICSYLSKETIQQTSY